MASVGLIVRLNCFMAVFCAWSCTCTIKVDIPELVGVPLTVRTLGSDRSKAIIPGGGAPPARLQLNGDGPPTTLKLYPYCTFTSPAGSIGGSVIVRLEPIVRVKPLVTERPPTITVILKVNVPVALGLPLNTFPLSVRPAGGASMDQVAAPGGPSEALKLTE
jgi:hypothetical protein